MIKLRFHSLHRIRIAVLIAILAAFASSSCIGRFALTNKLLAWNKTVGGKFVNELVFIAFWILPVYEVSSLADLLVINSIEFWSGSNPIALKPGEKKVDYASTASGEYRIEADDHGYTVTSVADGTVTRLDFDADERTWSVITQDGSEYELLTFIDDTHVALPAPGCTRTVVSLDEAGLMAYERLAAPAHTLSALAAR